MNDKNSIIGKNEKSSIESGPLLKLFPYGNSVMTMSEISLSIQETKLSLKSKTSKKSQENLCNTLHTNKHTKQLFYPNASNTKFDDSLIPKMKMLSTEFIDHIEVSSRNKSSLETVKEIKTKINSAAYVRKRLKRKQKT